MVAVANDERTTSQGRSMNQARKKAAPALRRLLLVCALAACGGGSARPEPSPPAATPASAARAPAPQPNTAPLSELECDRLADHLVELSLAEAPAERGEPYTAEDVAAAKRELRASMKPACAQLSRRAFECALAARTKAELAACPP